MAGQQRTTQAWQTLPGFLFSVRTEQVLSCWVFMIIPIPLPQHQHTFFSKTRAILVEFETSSLTKKCAGAEGKELVLV